MTALYDSRVSLRLLSGIRRMWKNWSKKKNGYRYQRPARWRPWGGSPENCRTAQIKMLIGIHYQCFARNSLAHTYTSTRSLHTIVRRLSNSLNYVESNWEKALLMGHQSDFVPNGGGAEISRRVRFPCERANWVRNSQTDCLDDLRAVNELINVAGFLIAYLRTWDNGDEDGGGGDEGINYSRGSSTLFAIHCPARGRAARGGWHLARNAKWAVCSGISAKRVDNLSAAIICDTCFGGCTNWRIKMV